MWRNFMAETLILYGSPNKNSFTMKLLKSVIYSDDETYFFDCFKSSPKPCDGCGFCKTEDNCKFNDLDEFFSEFEKAKNVIIAFPIYNGGFPAPLKGLIDRFQFFYNRRFFKGIKPPIKGNRDVTLVITAGSNENPLPLITAQLKPVFTVCGCKLKKAVMLLGTDKWDFNLENIQRIDFE